jgi:6-phosphogluconolactonase
MLSEYFLTSRAAAAAATAERLQQALESALATGDKAALVLSGGSSPLATFAALSQKPLPWNRVTITLSDERWVAATEQDSNERMLRETLLTNRAAVARLLPLYRAGTDVDAAPPQLQQEFSALPRPVAATLLGMGEDGHFASLFPDFAGLQSALSSSSETSFVAVRTAASPHPRISMTLSALLQSREIILLIFGANKRRVYENARAANSTLPVAALLAQARVPLRVIWAP